MTSILNKTTSLIILSLLLIGGFWPLVGQAQSTQTLSISPSLFDMSVNPGQEWRSSLKVINVNDYDLTIYVDVVNFLPQGETGDGRFVPINAEETKGSTLAEWFVISREAIVIPREQTYEVPLAVRVPADASPGGHFAAILVGTKPLDSEDGQARVMTSQMVTSLFFARVAGDIKEFGTIREFTTAGTVLSRPEATFDLRFENKGNVHLQPQGEIKITNMWGEERGIIPINQSTQFGNVLPESIRKFTFNWKGEWSISDIGRYKAEATLAYGIEERQFASAATYFWVIPLKLLLGILVGLGAFVALTTWLVRLYVARMLTLAGFDVNEYKNANKNSQTTNRRHAIKSVSLHHPVRAGWREFWLRYQMATNQKEKLSVCFDFLTRYKLVLGGLFLFLIFLATFVWFVIGANTAQRSYEVEYVNADANTKLSSEEIIYNQFKRERTLPDITVDESLPQIEVVNRSGVPGMGAEIRLRLETKGYQVVRLASDFTVAQTRTVIVYTPGLEKEALRISARLSNAPISITEEATAAPITIYVGDDIEPE